MLNVWISYNNFPKATVKINLVFMGNFPVEGKYVVWHHKTVYENPGNFLERLFKRENWFAKMYKNSGFKPLMLLCLHSFYSHLTPSFHKYNYKTSTQHTIP